MSAGADTRFKPGQSGNPKGRPKHKRPNISAFEIILDKTLSVTQGGRQRDFTVEEALQQQTLKDALAGKRMAIRKILKMIEKREAALAKKNRVPTFRVTMQVHHSADNADEAMRILGIASRDPAFEGNRIKLETWAAQAALGRPGRSKLSAKEINNICCFTFDSSALRWPRERTG